MSSEKTLYLPCKAAHSPKRLENIVAEYVANMIISGSVPQEIKKSTIKSIHNCDHLCCLELDKIILGASKHEEQQDMLKNQFKNMKSWWEENSWFGSPKSPLRELIQESISQLLDQMDYYSHCPLFRFTCQLCYTKRSGIFNQNSVDIVVKVPKSRCNTFASFLKSLGPFQVEQLLNVYMIFGNPNPLVVIVKNSPLLKSIYLRYNSCDYIISHVGKYCPKIERFILESFLGNIPVSENYLYKTFFRGKSKTEVINDDCDSSTLSFPNLSEIDVGHGAKVQQFLFYISLNYPGIKSLSCNSVSQSASYLLSSFALVSEKFIAFQIVDICLTSDCLITLNDHYFLQYFPNIKHVTLKLDSVHESQLSLIKERVTNILRRFHESISILIPFESIDDDELSNIFIPLFTEIGSSIKALQFDIARLMKMQLIWTLINLCPNLELLSFCFVYDLLYKCPFTNVNLLPLLKLKNFSYIVQDNSESINNINTFILPLEDILQKAPSLINFEAVLPSVAREWILTAVAKNYIGNVTTFVLKLNPYDDMVDVDFYVVLIEAMTSLKRLVLIGLSPTILLNLRQIFMTTQLRVFPGRRESYVAYHGIHSKYSLSANGP